MIEHVDKASDGRGFDYVSCRQLCDMVMTARRDPESRCHTDIPSIRSRMFYLIATAIADAGEYLYVYHYRRHIKVP